LMLVAPNRFFAQSVTPEELHAGENSPLSAFSPTF
jgi:hypothetical protein